MFELIETETSPNRQLDGDDQYQDVSDHYEAVTDPKVWTMALLGIMVCLLIVPFAISKRRRKVCYRSFIRKNDDNNDQEDDDNADEEVANPAPFVRRYPLGDPRHKFTLEEAQEETESFILEKLKQYSKVIAASDFESSTNDDLNKVFCNDIEEGQITPTTAHSFISTSDSRSSGQDSSNNSTASNESIPKQALSFVSLQGEDMTTANSTRLKLPSPGVCFSEYSYDDGFTQSPQCTLGESVDRNDSVQSISKKGDQDVKSKEKKKMKKKKKKYNSLQVVSTEEEDEEGHSSSYTYRHNECSICLSPFSEGETVSWSALQNCKHVFHQECILHWLTTKGHQSLDDWNDNNIMQVHIGQFEAKCPNCRQDFLQNSKRGKD